jgi:hypothetical protein
VNEKLGWMRMEADEMDGVSGTNRKDKKRQDIRRIISVKTTIHT